MSLDLFVILVRLMSTAVRGVASHQRHVMHDCGGPLLPVRAQQKANHN